jgi:hypothetical protein
VVVVVVVVVVAAAAGVGVVVVAAGAELADPRTVRISHLARQTRVISMPRGKSFAKVELAAMRVSLRRRLLWQLETEDPGAAETELGLYDAEIAGVDS